MKFLEYIFWSISNIFFSDEIKFIKLPHIFLDIVGLGERISKLELGKMAYVL